jgi:hypothetical protein
MIDADNNYCDQNALTKPIKGILKNECLFNGKAQRPEGYKENG